MKKKNITRVKAEVLQETPYKHKKFMRIKERIKEKIRPRDVIMLEMYHINGSISHLIILKNKHKFNYGGMSYIIDEDRKIWNNSGKMYMFRFHEGFSLPFSVDVSAPKLKRILPADVGEISTSYNPYVLKDVLKFEYARGVIQGAEIHDYLKKTFFMTIVTTVVVIVSLAVTAYMSGWI